MADLDLDQAPPARSRVPRDKPEAATLAETLNQGRRGGGGLMTSGSFSTKSSSGNRAGNSEDDEDELADAAECENAKTGTDRGRHARCTTTKCGTPKGTFNCVVNTTQCQRPGGNWTSGDACKSASAFGPEYSINSCPDGEISEKGVFVPLNAQGYCVAWSSFFAAMGMMECNHDKSFCGKAGVKHFHGMSKSTAVLVYKRLKCDGKECYVHKVGRCIDVGEKVYSSTLWDEGDMAAKALQYNRDFGTKAMAKLAAGQDTECKNPRDVDLASSGIKAY